MCGGYLTAASLDEVPRSWYGSMFLRKSPLFGLSLQLLATYVSKYKGGSTLEDF